MLTSVTLLAHPFDSVFPETQRLSLSFPISKMELIIPIFLLRARVELQIEEELEGGLGNVKGEGQKEEEEKEIVRLEGRAGEEELRGCRGRRGRAWTWTLGVASERAP